MIAPANHTPSAENFESFLPRMLRTLRRQWKRAAVFFAATMALVVIGVFVVPRSYRSEAKLFVRMGRESVTLDPTATTGKVMSVYESRENEINSVMEVIQSRVVLDRVVRRLGPEAILSGDISAVETTAAVAGKSDASQFAHGDSPGTEDTGPSKLHEKAVQRLERMVHISHAKKSAVITIGCKAGSPELAQRIVREILDGFRELHMKVNRTAGSKEFFARQVKLIDKQLAAASLELRTEKNKLGMTSIEDQRKTLQELIRENRTAAQLNAAEAAGIDSTITSLKRSLAELPATRVASKVVGLPNSALDRTRQRLNELLITERQLLTRFTVNHPDVIAVQQQIAAAKAILAKREPGDAQSTTASNPTAQQLQLRLLTEQARAKALQAKAAELKRQHAALLAQLKTLNDHEGRLTQLKQDVVRLQAAHKTYSEKFEQSRIDWALGEEQISNVNVVQPPSYVSKPVSPKKRIVLFLGLIVAAIGAVGFACLSEFLQRRKESPTETAIFQRERAVPVGSVEVCSYR